MNRMLMVFEGNALEVYPSEYFNNHSHEEAGIDLYVPENIVVPAGALGFKIDLKVKCCLMQMGSPIPYLLMCRSSIIKYPLRQSNSVGLIDAGYRGTIKFPVDNLHRDADGSCFIEKGTRLCQLVAFDGKPIVTTVVNSLPGSKRGDGGFGSTGA